MQKMTVYLISTLFALNLLGCATKAQTGALAGGAIGGGTGAAVGGAVGGKKGALLGGALGVFLGAIVGAEIGRRFDEKQERTRIETVKEIGYKPEQGNRLTVPRLEVTPIVAKPGNDVRVKVRYSVVTPEPTQEVPITETWVFRHENKEVAKIERPAQNKPQGEHSTTYTFPVKKDILPGPYQVLVTVSDGEQNRTVAAPFSIEL